MQVEAGPLRDEVERGPTPAGPVAVADIRRRYLPVVRALDDAVDASLDDPAAEDPDELLMAVVLRHLDEPPPDEQVGLVRPEHLTPAGRLGRLGELVRSEQAPTEVATVVVRAALRQAGHRFKGLRDEIDDRRAARQAPHRRPPAGPVASPLMNETAAPRHYTDQELALWTISLVFQRARAAQRELRGLPPDGGADGRPVGTATGPDRRSDDPLDTPALPVSDETSPLPNPIVTSANLRHHLDAASANRGPAGSGPRQQAARAVASLHGHQAAYNEAVINALHQLDHRTRAQSRTIADLEAELAEARRAIAALEAARDQP